MKMESGRQESRSKMKYPYLIYSDVHFHNWSAFSEVLPNGLNSRLQTALNEYERAYDALFDAGGNQAFNAGDTFHVRGKIEPSVFNPVVTTTADIHCKYTELRTDAVPGNHDLEGKHADELGNAMQSLGNIEGYTVHTKVRLCGDVLMVPWFQDLDELRAILAHWSLDSTLGRAAERIDVIIHAPMNGVIKGIPDHGLEARELAAYGFRRIFCGHYHDYKVFEHGKVVSVGAAQHQTWGDPGSLAGFLLVYEDRIEHHATKAPLFVDLHHSEVADEHELAAAVKGNYVRFKTTSATEEEKRALDAELRGYGALGVNIITEGKKAVTRTGTTVSASKTLEASTGEYVENVLKPKYVPETQKLCAELLAQARSAA